MPALDSLIAKPDDLPPVIPPIDANYIKDQIEPRVAFHLKQTIKSTVHYENQLYGCWNALLGSIFPLHRRFMVIPQALIRKVVVTEEASDENLLLGDEDELASEHMDIDDKVEKTESETEEDEGFDIDVKIKEAIDGPEVEEDDVVDPDISFGSTGGEHESRNLSGTEAFRHPRREPSLKGFLICGSTVREYTVRGPGRVTFNRNTFDLFTLVNNGDRLATVLAKIASYNW